MSLEVIVPGRVVRDARERLDAPIAGPVAGAVSAWPCDLVPRLGTASGRRRWSAAASAKPAKLPPGRLW